MKKKLDVEGLERTLMEAKRLLSDIEEHTRKIEEIIARLDRMQEKLEKTTKT